MNTKICTSIEQSKKLIELGIDINTADLTVTNYPLQDGSRFDFICCKLPNDTFPSITDGKSEKIPAWSLTALLGLIEWDYNLEKTLFDQSDFFTYSIVCDDLDFRTYEYDDPIDAAFEMICWLKKYYKI